MTVVHSYKAVKRVRIIVGWEDEGKEGWCYGYVDLGLHKFAIVLWDADDDPDYYKVAGLEERYITWGALI